jgi:hypothetical protein
MPPLIVTAIAYVPWLSIAQRRSDLLSVLSEPQRWACADYLQHIRLTWCQSIHAAIFSKQLAAGIFGHPRTVRLAFCDDHADQENLLRAPRWNIPSLELLEVNNFTPCAMEYLGQIHTEVVRLEGLSQWGYGVLVEALKDDAVFPGVQFLEISGPWRKIVGNLQEVCLSRGIKTVQLAVFHGLQ